MKKILIVSFLGLALIMTGCGNQTPDVNNQSVIENGSTNVIIQNFAFTPEVLTVTKGTAVTWTNKDFAPHQIKSEIFNSTRLKRGDNFSFTFNQTGEFDYICTIHSNMKGKIIVQ